MNTNTTVSQEKPLRIKFARKPNSLDEVLHNADPDPTASHIAIEKTVALSEFKYDEFARNLLGDREWLKGLGGWLDKNTRNVVMVTASNRTTLFVDPSGGAYGRYVGIAI